jgi:hypothetical protein
LKITIQILIEGAEVPPVTVPIHSINRHGEQIEKVGLQTAEAKSILKGLEENVIGQQLAEFLAAKRSCPRCQRSRAIKGYHPLRFRSAFGDVSLRSPRWHRCECAPVRRGKFEESVDSLLKLLDRAEEIMPDLHRNIHMAAGHLLSPRLVHSKKRIGRGQLRTMAKRRTANFLAAQPKAPSID